MMGSKTINKKSTQTGLVRRIFDFIGEIKSEMKKTNWTSREELLTYTKIVILATFIFSMVIYFMDLIIHQILQVMNLIFKMIGG